MITIKPKLPILPVLYGIFLLLGSIYLISSPYANWTFVLGGSLIFSVGLLMLWIADYAFMHVSYNMYKVSFRGYFGLRNLEFSYKEIEGYQIHQKADQISGFHEELQLVLPGKNKNLIIPTIAYSEENHKEIRRLFEAELPFLGFTELKYGKLIGKVLLIMFALTGVLSSFVGIMKLLNS